MTTTHADRIKHLLSEHLGVDDARVNNPDTKLTADLGADSMDIVEIVMACEEEFEIELSDDEMYKVDTVGDLIKLVDSKL